MEDLQCQMKVMYQSIMHGPLTDGLALNCSNSSCGYQIDFQDPEAMNVSLPGNPPSDGHVEM